MKQRRESNAEDLYRLDQLAVVGVRPETVLPRGIVRDPRRNPLLEDLSSSVCRESSSQKKGGKLHTHSPRFQMKTQQSSQNYRLDLSVLPRLVYDMRHAAACPSSRRALPNDSFLRWVCEDVLRDIVRGLVLSDMLHRAADLAANCTLNGRSFSQNLPKCACFRWKSGKKAANHVKYAAPGFSLCFFACPRP